MGEAMRSIVRDASAVKQHYDRSWIVPNVRRALDEAVRNGVLHVQAFVDVDTTAGLEGMASVLEAREEYRDLVDLQVVAFPQDGLLRDPGAAELCEEAMRLGADVVGGIPWIELTDRDAAEHVQWACRLAAATGSRVAMLTDDAGDPALRTTAMLAEAMIEHGLQGRGVACHARALATYPTPSIVRLADLARAAGLGFVSDPHTGPLHLPVREFLDEDLPVALGQDDIEDAYYPFGRHNMLEVAFLAAHVLGFLSGPDQLRLLDLVTVRAARVLGIEGHGIAVGNRADLCVHHHERVVDVLREHARPRWVLRGAGRRGVRGALADPSLVGRGTANVRPGTRDGRHTRGGRRACCRTSRSPTPRRCARSGRWPPRPSGSTSSTWSRTATTRRRSTSATWPRWPTGRSDA